MVKGDIACFFTGGYTEAGGLQAFLRKINSNYVYHQCLPNKAVKRKGMPKTIGDEISGLTGEALLKEIYKRLESYKDSICQYKAVIIEDDADDRFKNFTQEQFDSYQQEIIEHVHKILGVEMPVFIMYAVPEVEAWFVADWANGFEYLYCDSGIVKDVDHEACQFFSFHLRRYIDQNILKECKDDIEKFGQGDDTYVKLSDEIIHAILTGVKDEICKLPKANPDYVKQIAASRRMYYSKKYDGVVMLKHIDPEEVVKKCRYKFKDVYHKLKEF